MQGSDNSGYGTYPTPDGGTGGNGDGFGDEVWGEQALTELFAASLVLYFILWVWYNLFLRSNGRGEEQTHPVDPSYGEQSELAHGLPCLTCPDGLQEQSGEGSDLEGAHGGPEGDSFHDARDSDGSDIEGGAHGGPGGDPFYDARGSDESDTEGPDAPEGPEGPLSGVSALRHRRDGRGQ